MQRHRRRQQTFEQRQRLHPQRRQSIQKETAEERGVGLSQKYYKHQFDFELVQDGDRSTLFSSFCERFIDN